MRALWLLPLLAALMMLSIAAAPHEQGPTDDGCWISKNDGVPVLLCPGVYTGEDQPRILARDCDGDGEWSYWIRYKGWELDSVYHSRVMPAWEVCEGYTGDNRSRPAPPAPPPTVDDC